MCVLLFGVLARGPLYTRISRGSFRQPCTLARAFVRDRVIYLRESSDINFYLGLGFFSLVAASLFKRGEERLLRRSRRNAVFPCRLYF